MAYRRHRTMRAWLGSAAFALALALSGGVAWAQSVLIQDTGIDRQVTLRDGNNKPYWVSHSDCVANDVFTFPVDLTSFSGKSLEVWAGPDCTNKAEREGDQADCWKVYDAFPQKTTIDVKVRAQDIVAKVKPGGANSGTATDCERTDVATGGEGVTLHFMLLDSNNEVAGTPDTFESGFDVIGPPAPTAITAGIGENQLVVGWDTPTADDLAGYRIYCDSGSGPGSSPAAGGSAGATDAATDVAAEAAATDAGVGGADSGTGGSGGTGGTGGSGGGSAGNPDCPSAALTPGTIPSADYLCGSTSNRISTEATASDLQNGVTYAVAVAAVDTLGNSGPLSSVACGTPQPVNDFFELYRRAGGKGGGGFCAIGANPSHTLLALAGVAAGAWLVRRRRRRA